jgi:hypothetical protein
MLCAANETLVLVVRKVLVDSFMFNVSRGVRSLQPIQNRGDRNANLRRERKQRHEREATEHFGSRRVVVEIAAGHMPIHTLLKNNTRRFEKRGQKNHHGALICPVVAQATCLAAVSQNNSLYTRAMFLPGLKAKLLMRLVASAYFSSSALSTRSVIELTLSPA